METWIIYGFIAAILITSRDFFTSNYTSKYTVTEHLLYYYVLCGLAMSVYVCYRKVYLKEKVRLIDKEDFFRILLIAFPGAVVKYIGSWATDVWEIILHIG